MHTQGDATQASDDDEERQQERSIGLVIVGVLVGAGVAAAGAGVVEVASRLPPIAVALLSCCTLGGVIGYLYHVATKPDLSVAKGALKDRG